MGPEISLKKNLAYGGKNMSRQGAKAARVND
jgi:hypothetical protein